MSLIAPKHTRSFHAVAILAILICAPERSVTAQDHHQTPAQKTVSVLALAAPQQARDHLEKARRAMAKGHEAEYERELAASLALYPRYAEAYLLRSSHELLLDRYPEAIDAALTAQRLEPSIHWATILHAIACNQLKLFDEASTLLDGLAPPESDTWQAIFEKTRAALGTGDLDAALRWSERALIVVPPEKIDDTLLLRGDALLMAHRWPEAVAKFKDYLRSPRPQPKRTEVLALLERIPQLASREPAPLIALTQKDR